MYRVKSTVSNTLPCGIQIVTLIDQTMVTAFLKGWSYIGCSPVIRDYSYFQQLPTDDGDKEGQESSEIDSMVLTLTILPQIETITLFSSKNFSGISIKVSSMPTLLLIWPSPIKRRGWWVETKPYFESDGVGVVKDITIQGQYLCVNLCHMCKSLSHVEVIVICGNHCHMWKSFFACGNCYILLSAQS